MSRKTFGRGERREGEQRRGEGRRGLSPALVV